MNPVEIEMNFPAEHGGNVFGQFDAYMKKIEKTLQQYRCLVTQQAVIWMSCSIAGSDMDDQFLTGV